MDRLTQYLNSNWVIESNSQKAEFAFVLSALKNANIEAIETYLAKDKVTAYATAEINTISQYELSDVNLPDNSIAVISVQGTLYAWKTFDIEYYISQAIINPKIVGILIFMNSPGGMIHRIDIASNLIAQSPKPVLTFITGCCCSGGIWLASGSSYIMASSPLDIIGSIGTKASIWDATKYWADLGIIDKDLYARASTMKDFEYREFIDNNNDNPILDSLDFANNIFHQTISKNLNIPIDTNSDVFKGAVFHSEKAIEHKLINSIGTFEDALRWVLATGLARKANSIY